jgi:hypothetical protein
MYRQPILIAAAILFAFALGFGFLLFRGACASRPGADTKTNPWVAPQAGLSYTNDFGRQSQPAGAKAEEAKHR